MPLLRDFDDPPFCFVKEVIVTRLIYVQHYRDAIEKRQSPVTLVLRAPRLISWKFVIGLAPRNYPISRDDRFVS